MPRSAAPSLMPPSDASVDAPGAAAGAAAPLASRSAADIALSTDEPREVAQLAGAGVVILLGFVVVTTLIAVATGDVAMAVGSLVEAVVVVVLLQARRQVLRGQIERGALLLIVAALLTVLVMAPIPPPVPALAAAPLLIVAVALSFLRGRRRKVVLIAAWIVSMFAAIIVEVTPDSPAFPAELAAALRVGSFATIVGLVGLVLYLHRRRLEQAVTRAQTAGEALRDSEVRYRTLVEGVREVIFRVDGEGRWLLLNHSWQELTGHLVSDSIGRPVNDFIHADDLEHHTGIARLVVEGELGEYQQELRLVAKDGSDIWVEVRGRRFQDESGLFQGLTGTLTDVTARRELEDRLLKQAFHDDLTGLANRALFKDRVEHALVRRSQGRRLVALLFLDLDRFKTVNDSLGHTVGDGLLVAIAARLHCVLRPEDTIARLGGDEFGILIDDMSRPQEALALAERISAAFDAPFQLDERAITIRCSIGVVLASGGHRTADDLLRDADVAMYRAKASGRGSYALFEPSMQAEVAARLELESDLREAIEHERLTLAYQPIVDLRDRRIVAVEALARWSHPERGDVPPLRPGVLLRAARTDRRAHRPACGPGSRELSVPALQRARHHDHASRSKRVPVDRRVRLHGHAFDASGIRSSWSSPRGSRDLHRCRRRSLWFPRRHASLAEATGAEQVPGALVERDTAAESVGRRSSEWSGPFAAR